jgi:hypothetical protein
MIYVIRADAELLTRDFGGSLLYIRKSGDGRSSRDQYIVNAIKAGVRRADIAMSLDISQRHLRRLTECPSADFLNRRSRLSDLELRDRNQL